MTAEQPESTYFEGMDPSLTEWVDTSELGRAIVTQLRIDDHDMVRRWMAFRLAELLDCADSDDSAKEMATDLVLQIWRARWDWPIGWPPATLKNHLGWLFRPEQPYRRSPSDAPEELMVTVTEALKREYKCWLKLAAYHSFDLTPEEETVLAAERSPSGEIMRWLIERDRPSEEAMAASEPAEELESILEARRELLEKAIAPKEGEVSDVGASS